jgi:hypothetical protein
MRTTQYIGLTKKALEYVATLTPLSSDTSTSGMFGEEIILQRWAFPKDERVQNSDTACIREIVQEIPWSSGPMIFTYLEFDYGNGFKFSVLEWIHDPAIRGQEYNQETGTFWI